MIFSLVRCIVTLILLSYRKYAFFLDLERCKRLRKPIRPYGDIVDIVAKVIFCIVLAR